MRKINGKKRNKWIPIICIFTGILIIVGSVTAYVLVRDLKQEDILRNEINNLSKKDFTKDRYKTRLKTKEDYAVVEDTIKKIYDEYALNLQSISKIAADKQMAGLLSLSNYKKDGPDFIKTKKYLNETKTSFNTKLTELSTMISEEELMKRIEGKGLDQYYVDLYRELMLGETAENDFKTSQEHLKKLEESINGILNTEEAVIDLLISEKGKWTLDIPEDGSEGKIVFESTDTLNTYNELIKNYQDNK